MNTNCGHAQTDQSTTAKADIVSAFHSIQNAQQQGASNTDLLPLINQLNVAIQEENIASTLQSQNATRANEYAQLSINLSTTVSIQAQQLGNAAQRQANQREALAYALSMVVALIAAACFIEAPRAKEYLARRRLRRSRIVYGGKNRAE